MLLAMLFDRIFGTVMLVERDEGIAKPRNEFKILRYSSTSTLSKRSLSKMCTMQDARCEMIL